MLKTAWLGLRNLLGFKRANRDLQDELSSFFEAAVAEKVATGATEAEARRAVRLEHGTTDAVAEQVREVQWETTWESIWRDVRFGVRILKKHPGVTFVAVMTLALGIGSTTAVFSVMQGVLLRPFPFKSEEQLMMLWQKRPDGKRNNVGFATEQDWRRMNHSFSGMSAVSFWSPTLVSSAEPEVLDGFRVSAGTFQMLGVRMALGRDFVREEDERGHGTVVILSHALWVRRYGSDPAIIGKTVQLASKQYTVVGVLPSGFPSVFSSDPRRPADIYSPLAYDTSLPYACRGCQHLRVIGRLREGVKPSQALADMNQISDDLYKAYPTEYSNPGVLLTSLRDYVVGDVRMVLLAMQAAVGFVLLIACANVSNLLLSSAVQRRREFALRRALGAQPARLVRQLLTESLLIALCGGTAGTALAYGIVHALPRFGLTALPRVHDIRLDWQVLLFTLLVCVVSSAVFGILPALQARDAAPAESLSDGVRATTSASGTRSRNALITWDVAISLVLLVSGGLMGKSFLRLIHTDPGFSPANVLTMSVSLWGAQFSKDDAVLRFYRDALTNIAAVPGVDSVALTSQLPLGGNMDRYTIHRVDRPSANPEQDPSADRYSISPDYFHALKIPIVRGREFTAADDAKSPFVVIVNETFARTLWPGENAIGKQIRVGDTKSSVRTVVGVAGDVLHASLDAPHTMQFYLPSPQFTDSDVTLVVRTKGIDPASITSGVRGAIAAVDPQQPISDVATMDTVVAASAAQRRFAALLFAAFALCGVFMAAVGIYAVISYSVAQRTQEIGIRMAMGAPTGSVLKLVLTKGMQPAVLGVLLGLPLSLALSRFLRSLLFAVTPNDGATYLLTSAIVCIVSLLACYLPARRATQLDVVSAIRSE